MRAVFELRVRRSSGNARLAFLYSKVPIRSFRLYDKIERDKLQDRRVSLSTPDSSRFYDCRVDTGFVPSVSPALLR